MAIAEELEVSMQTVKNYSSNMNNFGKVLPPKTWPQGCPSALNKEMCTVSVSITFALSDVC